MLLLLDEAEPPLHVGESRGRDPVLRIDLIPAGAQERLQPLGIDAPLQDAGDVVEAESEFAQGDDPMQPIELRGVVGAEAAELVHVGGHEQALGIPMPQLAMGHLADLRERSDGQHAPVLPSDTVSGSSIAAARGGRRISFTGRFCLECAPLHCRMRSAMPPNARLTCK